MMPAPKSVLVYVGGDLVGDAIMKLPFVRALRQAWPAARITWCAGKHRSAFAHELAPLTAGLIDEVIEQAGFDRPFSLVMRRPLAGRHFDLVIDTQRGVGTTFLLRRVRHETFISGTANFLFSGIRPSRPYRRPASMVTQMTDLLALASGKPALVEGRLSLAAEVQADAARALPAGPVYVGLAPGAGGRQKCWPLDNFIALAHHQMTANRVPVFILGPGEADMIDTLRDAVPGALFPTLDKNGKPSPTIDFTIAIGQTLAAAIANDSGAGHILAASDVPLVSLFGPTPAAKFAPTAKQLEIINATAFGSTEMSAIPVEAVAVAVDKLILRTD